MDPRTITSQANNPQADFLELPHKFRAFVGGFGSGKTWIGCVSQSSHFWEYPRINQGYFAPTFTHIRDIYFPTVEEAAFTMGLRVDIKEGNKEVHFYNGAQYRGTTICRSMDNPASIVGFKIGHSLIDEIDILKKEKAKLAWNKIIARMRTLNAPNNVDVTTTPEGFNFVYERFAEKPKSNYGMIQASTYENRKNLPPDYIDSLLETYPQELIDAYLLGKFVNLRSGTVFNAYNRFLHRSRECIQEKEPLRVGMDFNVTNMSAVIYVLRNGNQWHAVDELKGIYDTPAMIEIIKERYREHHIRVYPDATGKNRETVDASKSDISLLEAAGFLVYADSQNPRVRDRVISTNIAFQNGLLYINDEKCPDYAKCMEQLPYDKNGEIDKSLNLDHLPDAGTYPIAFEMPVVKPVSNLKLTFAR